MAITRKEFNARLAKKWGIPKRKAKVYSQLFFDTLMECLREDEVNFIGFGKFVVKERNEAKARNMSTGEGTVTVPAHKKLKFYAGKGVEEKILEGGSSYDEDEEE
ncbi:MAG: HU family DNA-binding protein [Lachnospiraceae bacterium]|jgi:Bacterial nucleoid DNA-binding protein